MTEEEKEETKIEQEIVKVPETTLTKKNFINTRDVALILDIMAAADNISKEEAIKRLNTMCEKGFLTIVPQIGRMSR